MLQILLVCSLFLSSLAQAQESEEKLFKLLTPTQIRSLLGAYPAKGSMAEFNDFATILKFQLSRTEQDCAEAAADEKVSISHLFAGPRGPLTRSEARLTPRLALSMGEIGANILTAKNLYKRPRPYIANPLIRPCISKESSTAYPSGHTAFARTMAIILSRIYPEKSAALMKRADEVALNRVIGGVHHPTDIIAGKKLGDAIAAEALMSPAFVEELILNQ